MTQKTDLITIIVPLYNSAQYLPKCIESIQKQTYRNLQILLIDDGSLDGSLEICRKYAEQDPRIAVIPQKHAGVSAARNLGLDHTEGAFVSFIDSDDSVLPGYIEELHQALAKCDAAIVFAPMTVNGKRCGGYEFTGSEGEKIVPIKELELYRYLQGIGGMMIRTSDISEVRFDREIRYAEDKLFNLKVLCRTKSGKMLFIKNEPGYLYRMREESATHTKDSRVFQTHTKALQQMLDLTRGMALEQDLRRMIDRDCISLYMIMADDPQADKNECRTLRKQAVEAYRKGHRAGCLRGRVVEYLYLHHGRWIYRIYCRGRKLIHKKTDMMLPCGQHHH